MVNKNAKHVTSKEKRLSKDKTKYGKKTAYIVSNLLS